MTTAVSKNTLQISAEFTVDKPKHNYTLIITSIVSLVGIVVLVAASYFFIPLAAAIAFTITGTLITAFDGMLIAARMILIPSASHPFKSSQNDSQYKVNASLKLKDGTILKGAMLQDKTKKNEEKHIVVLFHGNGVFANENHLKSYLKDTKIYKDFDALEMNYRGCSNSTGDFAPHSQYVKDQIEVVQSLLDQGYKLENMVLIGHSLGGSIATCVKEHFDKELAPGKKPCTLVAYHTFHKLSESISERIQTPVIKEIIKGLTKLTLSTLGWDVNFDSKRWNALKGKKVAIGGSHMDTVIPPNMSLANYLEVNKATGQIYIRNKPHMEVDLGCISPVIP
jgi:predicted alpha/beta-fold hydrolase